MSNRLIKSVKDSLWGSRGKNKRTRKFNLVLLNHLILDGLMLKLLAGKFCDF